MPDLVTVNSGLLLTWLLFISEPSSERDEGYGLELSIIADTFAPF